MRSMMPVGSLNTRTVPSTAPLLEPGSQSRHGNVRRAPSARNRPSNHTKRRHSDATSASPFARTMRELAFLFRPAIFVEFVRESASDE